MENSQIIKKQESTSPTGATETSEESPKKMSFNNLILIIIAAGLLVVFIASICLMLYCLVKCQRKKAELFDNIGKIPIKTTSSTSIPHSSAVVQTSKAILPTPVKRSLASITKPQTSIKPKTTVKPAEKQQSKKTVTKSSSSKTKSSSKNTSSTTPSKPKTIQSKNVEKSKEEAKTKKVPKVKEDATQKSEHVDPIQIPVENGKTFAFVCYEKREWRKLDNDEANDFSFQIESGNTFSEISDN